MLTLMFELITSYLHTSWWMVDPRRARIGETRNASGHFCAADDKLRTGAGNGRGREGERERDRERGGEGALMLELRTSLVRSLLLNASVGGWAIRAFGEQGRAALNASWWMVDSCMARLGEQRFQPFSLFVDFSTFFH